MIQRESIFSFFFFEFYSFVKNKSKKMATAASAPVLTELLMNSATANTLKSIPASILGNHAKFLEFSKLLSLKHPPSPNVIETLQKFSSSGTGEFLLNNIQSASASIDPTVGTQIVESSGGLSKVVLSAFEKCCKTLLDLLKYAWQKIVHHTDQICIIYSAINVNGYVLVAAGGLTVGVVGFLLYKYYVSPNPSLSTIPPPPPPPSLNPSTNDTTSAIVATPTPPPPPAPLPPPAPPVDLIQDTLCCICMDEVKTHLIVPCGHLAYCGRCVGSITTCSLCNGTIQRVVRVFL